MKKHAYLIVAHNQFELLKKQIKLIDYPLNDIYLHIDKKVKDFNFEEIKSIVKKSKLHIISRNKVGWGGYSQIKTTIDMLEYAIKNKYEYYHFISGVDLPIKTQEYIHEFFDVNRGMEFISFDDLTYSHQYDERIKYWWYLQEIEKQNKLALILNRGIAKIQSILNINRIKDIDFKLQKGANWFSITHDLATYVVEKKEWIEKNFKYSHCADEIFLQTIIINSKYKNRLYPKGNMRLIDWERGNPYIWKYNDFDTLIKSDMIFARKFNENVDKKIVEKIYNTLFRA